jgi:hypothetical protein
MAPESTSQLWGVRPVGAPRRAGAVKARGGQGWKVSLCQASSSIGYLSARSQAVNGIAVKDTS